MTALPTDTPAAATQTACTHCGLPVPRGLIEQGSPHQFCCQGCRAVFSIIHTEGLDDYYAMRRSLETDKARVPEASIQYDAYDDPAFAEAFSTAHEDGTTTATLSVDGLHCAACVWLIERLQRVVPAVISAHVHYGRATVDIRWRTGEARFSDIARGLHALGYPASPPRGAAQDERRRADARAQLIRIGVAGALAGNIMLVAVALYAGVFDGMDHATLTFFRWVSAILGVLTLAWPGRVFFRGALGAIRARAPHLDLPIALALFVGGAWGVANTIRGTGEIYFDSLAALVFLLLVGRFIQSQQQRRAADALDLLLTLTPSLVRVVRPDGMGTDTKPVEAVQLDDLAEILPGETIPVDGVVDDGESELDQSILTGESAPVPVRAGASVFAGAVNLSGVLRVRATAVGESTRAARLMRLVADAAEQKAPIVQTADRLAGWFVAIVATLAIATGIAWSLLDPAGGVQTAIEHATALLIVTCPCALGLATPLVLSATIGRLARAGVLVKGGVQLERLATKPNAPGLAVFDKTGTLTTGAMSAAQWTVDDDTARLVRTLEARSTHPIARAIAASGDHADSPATGVVNTQGSGLVGTLGGVRLAVGSDDHLRALGIDIPASIADWARAAAEAGETPILIAADGVARGGVSLTDTPRDDARDLIDTLTRAGWSVALLSGDDPRVVRRTAERLGIDPDNATGRVSPEGKLERIRELVRERAGSGLGPVVMIGDGVNDAAALAAADVGIAVQGGADASLDAADIFIQKGGLSSIARLTDASSGAIRRIRLCIGASLFYNSTAAALAMAGLVHPLLAAVLMPLSSLTVVSIAASGRLMKNA
jgi:Cu2+-exporting ATPase